MKGRQKAGRRERRDERKGSGDLPGLGDRPHLLLSFSLFFLLSFSLFSLLPARAHAQAAASDTTRRVVEFLGADVLERNVLENGEVVVQMTGNVRLRQEKTYLSARQAVNYETRREILFLGNVRIIEEGDTLFADRVRYDSANKIGFATGNVRLADGEAVLTAPSGEYFVDEKRAEFLEGVQLVDSTSVLVSRRGTYYSEEKRADFANEVRLTQENSVLEADSVSHFREEDITLARGNVVIERFGGEDGAEADSTLRTLLFGPSARHENQREYSRFDGGALLVQLRTDSTGATDTLLVQAVRLESTRQDTLRRLTAVGEVQFWQKRLAARADSVVYDRITLPADTTQAREEAEGLAEELRLFRSPVGWFDESQVTGDSLRLTLRDGSPDSLIVQQQAFVAQWDSTLQKIQQLKGGTLLGLFRDDSLRYVHVTPAAESVFFVEDEETQSVGQAFEVSADSVMFWISGDEVEKIKASRDAEGKVYDAAIIPETLQLSGLNWMPDRRPQKNALLPPHVRARLARDRETEETEG